eukprot:2854146-Ditylum_brightwellii.AAC.1
MCIRDSDEDHHDEDHHDEDHHDEDHHDEDHNDEGHHDEDHHDEDHHGHSSHSEDSEKKPWGVVIGTSILINLATLSGVILLIPLVKSSGLFGKNNDGRSVRQLIAGYGGKAMNI